MLRSTSLSPSASEVDADVAQEVKGYDADELALSVRASRAGTLYARLLHLAGRSDTLPELLEKVVAQLANTSALNTTPVV